MHPYRPLFVASTCEPPAASLDVRGLGAVLTLLGLLRLVPAFAANERFSAEVTIALAMLALGVLELSSLGPRLHRWRRIRRSAID